MRQWVVYGLGIALVWSSMVVPLAAEPVTEDPLQRQVLSIGAKLRCAVCQNQPISESNSDLAKDMREIIREQLVAGKSESEIIDYFVARYGDYVLLKPRHGGVGLPLWVLPPLLLLLVGWVGYRIVRQRGHRTAPPAPHLSAEDLERVRRARAANGGDT